MALPATAEFGGRGPESKAWSGCRKARAPKSEASVGFRKERLGVDAGKRGLEWFFGRRDLECIFGKPRDLEWFPESGTWSVRRKAGLGVGTGKRGLEWVPEKRGLGPPMKDGVVTDTLTGELCLGYYCKPTTCGDCHFCRRESKRKLPPLLHAT